MLKAVTIHNGQPPTTALIIDHGGVYAGFMRDGNLYCLALMLTYSNVYAHYPRQFFLLEDTEMRTTIYETIESIVSDNEDLSELLGLSMKPNVTIYDEEIYQRFIRLIYDIVENMALNTTVWDAHESAWLDGYSIDIMPISCETAMLAPSMPGLTTKLPSFDAFNVNYMTHSVAGLFPRRTA